MYEKTNFNVIHGCTGFMAVLAVVAMTGCDDEETVLQKYTVTFNSQGGSEVASQAVYAGEKIVKPANPTKEKEYFVDWYKEAECTNVWDFENETVSHKAFFESLVLTQYKTYLQIELTSLPFLRNKVITHSSANKLDNFYFFP